MKMETYLERFASKPYKENLNILKVVLTNEKWQAQISEFRKQNPTREKLQSDKSLERKFVKLINEILNDAKLPKKMFSFYVGWYILYNKFDAPFQNFLVNTTGDTVTVEFFRLPHPNDWKILQIDVSRAFQRLSEAQKVRIDERFNKTIDRRIEVRKQSRPATNSYDIVEEIWRDAEEKPELDRKRAEILRKDKRRLRELTKRVMGHN